jgi:hypothetical protein
MLGTMRRGGVPSPLGLAVGIVLLLMASVATPDAARSALLPGDLNGDGLVDGADETLFLDLWSARIGDANYDPAGDLNGDGVINALDLAIFGTSFGSTGGEIDATPPDLFVTLNEIPDDMNDLLVVPPEGFQITLDFDSVGGSLVDPSSLVVTNSEDIGPYTAGTDLAPLFQVDCSGAFWEVPTGSDMARTSHTLTVSLMDAAGNEALHGYGFAVRDFTYGPPLGNPQTIFLDFDQDRSLGAEIDFIEDLRDFGLSSATPLPGAEHLEAQMRDQVVAEIISRIHLSYGRNADGSPGPDAANVVFTSEVPGGGHSRLCVGGESSQGANFLGAATLDVNNVDEATDECSMGAQFGVFPNAIDQLWGASAEYQACFHPLDPHMGGTPVGKHSADAWVLSAGFDPGTATPEELARHQQIADGIDAFAQTVASAVAHEAGHMLGLTAPGPAPAGLWGGDSGGQDTHNVTTAGGTPPENFLMNQGGSFSFEEISGRGGVDPPIFRILNWAYLRDRVALNDYVFGLFPAPTLDSVEPAVISFPAGSGQNRTLRFVGSGFMEHPSAALPTIELLNDGLPGADPVFDVALYEDGYQCCPGCCLTGRVNKFFVEKVVYDVRVVNGDGQEVVLEAGLEVE